MTTICDTLDFEDKDSVLSILNSLRGDQSTIGELKSELEAKKSKSTKVVKGKDKLRRVQHAKS